jgi:hypothetical protein
MITSRTSLIHFVDQAGSRGGGALTCFRFVHGMICNCCVAQKVVREEGIGVCPDLEPGRGRWCSSI